MATTFYLYDTGLVNPEFDASETPFPNWDSATITQRSQGEFKATANPVSLKIETVNSGIKANIKQIPSLTSFKTKSIIASINPFKYTIQGFINKPRTYTGTDKKDLDVYKAFHLLQISKGHKDFYIKDDTSSSTEELFSLYSLIDLFGKTDSGNPDNKKHLNVIIDSLSFNEGKKVITFTMQLTIIPYFS